jgi:hypothetical protein
VLIIVSSDCFLWVGGWPGTLDFPLKQRKIVDFFRIQKGADEPQPAKCGLPQGNFAFLRFNGSLIVGSWTPV